MKYIITLLTFLYFFTPLHSTGLYAQQSVQAKNAMNAGPANYTTITQPFIDHSPEVLQGNLGYEQHPELGTLYAETPCDNCYELIGSRTEYSKTFIKEGTNSSKVMQQTSTMPMHYRDAQGRWMTIHTQLTGQGRGIYAATQQEASVTISTADKVTTLGKEGQSISFNHNLELVYVKPDGTEQPLGAADYSHYTAGDDGVYITNAWPGIDIEMHTLRGAVKTNFLINHAMPAYAGGKLLVRDHLLLGTGLGLDVQGQTRFTGNIGIVSNSGERVYAISAATAYEKAAPGTTLQMLEYGLSGNTLDIALPGSFLNRGTGAYPVIIDPLVSVTSTTTTTGSTYSSGWTVGCMYFNSATVPAKVTVTDVQFSFQYVTSGGALLNNGAFDFRLGTCRSPSPTSLYWNCNSALTGTCTGTAASVFSSLSSCMPAPQCTSYDMNLTMDFYQNYLSDPPCSNLYITAGTPLTVTVFGNTIETSAITASAINICQGQSTLLTATSQYGVAPYTYSWSPGSLTGTSVTETPTATTTYTVTSTDACGDVSTATKTINVNPLLPITGSTTLCVGASATLADAVTGGGTWSSNNTAVATIGATAGTVSAIATGTAIITFAGTTGCTATTTVSVLPAVAPITGSRILCIGGSSTLADATTGGSWSSSVPATASVGAATGVVNGIASGTSVISYGMAGVGCTATTTVTVNALAPITGTTILCVGNATALTDPSAGAGGVWTSSSPAIATTGSSAGIITGVSAGVVNITYATAAGCTATTTVTVNAPTPITGSPAVCLGSTTTLSNSTAGGVWTSGSSAIATISASSGFLTGISAGTVAISYVAPTGCTMTTSMVVNPIFAITGTKSLCVGGTATLNDAASGGGWTSSAPSIASIGSFSGLVTAAAPGTATITYTTFGGGCTATTTVSVNIPSPITGTATVCQGNVTTLSNTTAGGTWTTSDASIATVGGGSGRVSGVAGGTVTISYATGGACVATMPVTVNAISPIAGATALCSGNSITLTDAAPGGAWSSSSSSTAIIGSDGVVTGIAAGTTTIDYTTTSGCMAGTVVTVNTSPSSIAGSSLVCGSATFSNTVPGGTWASSNAAVATAGAGTGVITAVAAGVATISYTMPGGCMATMPVTVNTIAAITGTPTACQGSTSVLGYPSSGGTWSSLATGIATANSTTGLVTAVGAGATTIQYTTTSGCVATTSFTVYPFAPVTGTPILCQGSATALADGVSSGTWSSSDISVAPVDGTGVVTGTSPGTATITYLTTAGCAATVIVTVNPLQPITGVAAICAGSNTTLSDATTGGTWSSGAIAVATISTTGTISGITAGSSLISYTTVEGCVATVVATVNAMPSAISGPGAVCQSSAITLTNTLTGGTWGSSDPSIATISGAGVASGVAPGVASITYATSAGCSVSTAVTVDPSTPTTGAPAICQGGSTTLVNSTPGGTWSSLATGIATAGSATGIVTGISSGTATIRYITNAGCISDFSEVINPLPSAIGGIAKVCVGNTTTLSNTLAGGAWSSNNSAIATVVASSGIVSGIAAGADTIVYTSAYGCTASIVVTVSPLPLAITGTTYVCAGNTTALSDATTGGAWSSSDPATASIGAATGIVNGLLAGTVTASYITTDGCVANTVVTVDPVPAAIGGTIVLCQGATSTLTNTLTGGIWSSNSTAIATIDASAGTLAGVAAGNTIVSYTTSAGCYATTGLTVNPTPVISAYPATNPTTCITNDGTITLGTLTAGDSYTVNYTFGSGAVITTLVANTAGQVTISGLAVGNYTSISITTTLGCTSNVVAGPVTLVLPAPPPAPVATNNTPICNGSTVNLTATDATAGVTYLWIGPAGFISALQNPAIATSTMTAAGVYSVTATSLGCVSAVATTTVVIHPIPQIATISFTNPTTCQGTDGTITLTGLLPGVSYTIDYTFNATAVSAIVVANASGNVVITGIAAGDYGNFSASSFTCLSNTVGPVSLTDPAAPAVPVLNSNSPLCFGKTLKLNATDATNGILYEWTGPNGFTSNQPDPTIENTTFADSGVYTLTVRHLNCPATASEDVVIYPPVVLKNVTDDVKIPVGGSIQLNADSAEFYLWSPDDGTLSNDHANNPIATPAQTETYIVRGTNQWGCADSAAVVITVDDNITEIVPSAFTPDNDGLNDVFRIGNVKYDKLVEFNVYNRWGQLIYHNTSDVTKGWDGTFNGVPQDMGVYSYAIILSEPSGKNKIIKGTVTLIR
jgi:gliding motility-associated-like protein